LGSNGEILTAGGQTAVPQRLHGNTYRYFVVAKDKVEPGQPVEPLEPASTFVEGKVQVEFVAGTWQEQRVDATVDNIRSRQIFTIKSDVKQAAKASNPIAFGPLSLQGPSVGLADLGFNEGRVVITVSLGVDKARLNFGGTGNQTDPGNLRAPA
jgi:hypothetical protein